VVVTRRPVLARFIAVAVGTSVVITVAGCTATPMATDPPAVRQTSAAQAPASATSDELAEMADQLRSQVPCEVADTWHDDMSFWDSMRGFDCFDHKQATFVRTYAHDASVAQTLADWDGTFGRQRGVAHGRGWYVIGPPEVVAHVTGPSGRPPSEDRPPQSAALTPLQDYVTTCTRFTLSEAERYTKRPDRADSNAANYERLFPGVKRRVDAAIKALGLAELRGIDDESRPAALSTIGPEVKESCIAAYRRVGSGVQGVG
jgi:hypothetical protein